MSCFPGEIEAILLCKLLKIKKVALFESMIDASPSSLRYPEPNISDEIRRNLVLRLRCASEHPNSDTHPSENSRPLIFHSQ
jgi:hypothetical protein